MEAMRGRVRYLGVYRAAEYDPPVAVDEQSFRGGRAAVEFFIYDFNDGKLLAQWRLNARPNENVEYRYRKGEDQKAAAESWLTPRFATISARPSTRRYPSASAVSIRADDSSRENETAPREEKPRNSSPRSPPAMFPGARSLLAGLICLFAAPAGTEEGDVPTLLGAKRDPRTDRQTREDPRRGHPGAPRSEARPLRAGVGRTAQVRSRDGAA